MALSATLWALALSTTRTARSLRTAARPCLLRANPAPRLALPLELPDGGLSLERKLGEGSFAEVVAGGGGAEAVLSGRSGARVTSARVRVGLFYGQVTRGNAAGARVLVKAYSPYGQPPWAEDGEQAGPEGGASLSGEAAAALGLADVASSLEAALSSPTAARSGASLAEALALNEYSAHARVQAAAAAAGKSERDVEREGLTRLIGRQVERGDRGEPLVLHAFPWGGEGVRLAPPTRLPPTLGSWLVLRERGGTEAQAKWGGVPLRAAQQRGRFVRGALRGALAGLAALHAVGLLHQGLSPAAVLVSSEDDRVGEKVSSSLQELGYARDAPSLYPAFYVNTEGSALSAVGEAVESGDRGGAVEADPLDLGLAERALRRTTRPGDPEERARYGRADDMREFGLLLLTCFLLSSAQPDAGFDALRLRTLTDGPFAASDDDGMKTDGVDVAALRSFLADEEALRIGGVGGVEMLDAGGARLGGEFVTQSSGWGLLSRLLAPAWEDRPDAAEALSHPFWTAAMSPEPPPARDAAPPEKGDDREQRIAALEEELRRLAERKGEEG